MDQNSKINEAAYLPREDGGHIADYLGVLTRRLWLILVIFAATAGAAIWAVARQQTLYEASASLQVNDPIEPARGLVNQVRVSGLDFLDPIVSEIQVLKSSRVARAVADSLGLRLTPVDPTLHRSDLFLDTRVDSLAPESAYTLRYSQDRMGAALFNSGGEEIGRAGLGERLNAPAAGVSFTVQAPPNDSDSEFEVRVLSLEQAAAPIPGGIRATPRENTNIMDIWLVFTDPVLTDDVLNVASHELRQVGAQRVSSQANRDITFLQTQVDSVTSVRDQVNGQIQSFMASQDFLSLPTQERRIMDQTSTLELRIQDAQRVDSVLRDVRGRLDSEGPRNIDFSGVQASLPEGTAVAVTRLVNQIRDQRAEVRRLREEVGLGEANPRLTSAESELDALAVELGNALDSRVAVTGEQLRDLSRERADLQADRQAFPQLQARLNDLQSSLATQDQTLQYLRGQLEESRLRQAAAGPYIEIIDPAVNTRPLQPNGQINVLLGGLLGLVLGIGAAFFLEYLDRTVRTSSDVESLLGIPVLGIIPRLRRLDEEMEEPTRGVKGAPLVVALDPLDPAAEAYRNLRMNLMFMSTPETPIRSILFSSPGPDEGKSTTALNFAVMLSQQGQRVLLVDADLRRPSLHRSLDLLREPGLTNLLVGDVQMREAVRPNVLPNLDVLPSGPFPPNPSELLNSRAMDRLIEELEGKYTHIIIDSPPVLAVTDAAVLSGRVDGTVLVLRSGETEQRAAERSVDQLRRLGARVFGAVLNEVMISGADENYYLQYFYSYQPHEEKSWGRLRDTLTRARFW